MGCAESRDGHENKETETAAASLHPEEQNLIEIEKRLILSNLSAKQSIQALKCEALNDALSRAQLKRAILELEIPVDFLSDPEDITNKTLRQLRNQNKLYDAKMVSILAILIGKGTQTQKARWLFKQYDKDANGMLTVEEIEKMIEDLSLISIQVIPNLYDTEGINEEQKTNFQKYFASIVAKEGMFRGYVNKNLLTDGQVSETEFVAKLSENHAQLQALLSTVGVRQLVCNMKEEEDN